MAAVASTSTSSAMVDGSTDERIDYGDGDGDVDTLDMTEDDKVSLGTPP